VLMRGRGLKRCGAEGAKRFAVFVGAAVLANKLMIIAALLMKERSRRRKATRQPCSRCRARNQLRLADAGPAKNGAKTQITKSDPPALPGRQPKFDSSGSRRGCTAVAHR
jgi:hypothetical protein